MNEISFRIAQSTKSFSGTVKPLQARIGKSSEAHERTIIRDIGIA
jgi:hypothetical protein